MFDMTHDFGGGMELTLKLRMVNLLYLEFERISLKFSPPFSPKETNIKGEYVSHQMFLVP